MYKRWSMAKSDAQFCLLDIKEMLDKYRNVLVGRHLIVHTNYVQLSAVDIQFTEDQFVHLLGLQKLKCTDNRQSLILKQIDCGNLLIEDILNDPNFYEISDRIKYFDYIYSFLEEEDIFVSTKNMRPNRLSKCEFVIYKYLDDSHKKMKMIGFSPIDKNGENDIYVPATLHVRKAPNQFESLRRTQIKDYDWK